MSTEGDEIDERANSTLVSSVINYYGHGLLKKIADTHRHLLPEAAVRKINYNSFKERAQKLQ